MVQLSRREREVAELVAAGHTNREIAARLFISERTVEGHVQQINNKLGFTARTWRACVQRLDRGGRCHFNETTPILFTGRALEKEPRLATR